MENSIKEALKLRRSYYSLRPASPVPDDEIVEILNFAATYLPSPFNSQSSRMVLLLGDSHLRFWDIVRDVLRKIVPPKMYTDTETKINKSFASGYGTILFYEDDAVVKRLQEQFPLYSGNFPIWAQQTSAMHQLAVWTLLEDIGFGASLQHYNPLIDDDVRKEWSLPAAWKLIAQMPFGLPGGVPSEKPVTPVAERVKVFK